MAGDLNALRRTIRLGDLARGPVSLSLAADAPDRAAIAADLGLIGLSRLEASIRVRPWMDGAEITGRLNATVTQECGVTLDPFESDINADIRLHMVPAGSPNAPDETGELELDPEADDPPDVMTGPEIDLGAVVIEHLALSLDPFPRKPGAVFEPPPAESIPSPFSVLKGLKSQDES